MEKQTTAVNWLIENMINYGLLPQGIHADNVLFHKAKELERQQIENSYLQGFSWYNVESMDFEQYFNQTFK